MRTTFHQFFRPTKNEMNAMLTQALICYDANVLLNVYRYSEETQRGLIGVFKDFSDRTRLPHQVALEYARNRAKTVVEQVNLCQATEDAFNKVVKDYITPRDRQPFLSADASAALAVIMDELEKKRKALEAMISEDEYADLLLSLFEQKICAAPDETTLAQLHAIAAGRYAKKIPPGYSDLKEKELPFAYGDYVAWRQLMDIATREKKDFIFVTDDFKEDWRLKLSGKTIGPRPELLEEFRRETGQGVWLFSSEGFLIATNEAGSSQVAESVIEEVSAHLVAQTALLASGSKLSSRSVEHRDANAPAPDVKLSNLRKESAEAESFDEEAAVRHTKVTTPSKTKTPGAGEEYGGDE